MASKEKPSPFVFWAQTENAISLRVDLKNVTVPNVNLTHEGLEFMAFGTGARGDHEYHFKINFYKVINPDESRFRVSDRQVDFHIQKQEPEMWLRLMGGSSKPAWLKFDFDKLTLETDSEDNNEDFDDSGNSFNEMMRDVSKSKRRKERKVEELRRVYLFLYNLFQFVGFLYIVIVLLIRYAKDGDASMHGTFTAVGRAFMFCQTLQILEIIHPLLGFTGGGFFMPLVQVTGRMIMVFPMIYFEPRMQTKPAVFYLFLVYGVAEIIRYPYYMLRTYKYSSGFVTWLRYSAWMLTYPLGFLCEGVIILRNIPYFEETGRFSISLPNAWNVSFYFPSFLRIYLLCGFFPALYFMMTYMYRQRVKIIGPKGFKKKQ